MTKKRYLNDVEIADTLAHLRNNWARYTKEGATHIAIAKEVTEALGVEVRASRIGRMVKAAGLPSYPYSAGLRKVGSRGASSRVIARILVRADRRIGGLLEEDEIKILQAIANGQQYHPEGETDAS